MKKYLALLRGINIGGNKKDLVYFEKFENKY
jgi:uncharacterized protein (DUF1697 family)